MLDTLLIFISLAILLVILIVINTQLSKIHTHQQIQTLVQQKKIDEAIFLAESLVSKSSTPSNRFLLAKLYTEKERWGMAVPILTQIVKQDAVTGALYLKALYLLALSQLRLLILSQAEEHANILIHKDPQNYDNQILMADVFYQQKKYTEALIHYSEALKLRMDDEYAWIQSGHIYFQQKQHTEARETFLQATTVNPGNPTALYYLARSCQEMGETDEALRLYKKCLKLPAIVPTMAVDSLLHMGKIEMMFNPAQAVEIYSQAIGLSQNHDLMQKLNIARYYLADTYLLLDKVPSAIKEWKRILRVRHDFKDVSQKLTEYQAQQNNEFIKDLLTHSEQELYPILENFVTGLGYVVKRIQDFSVTIDVTVEDLFSMWRNKNSLVLFTFWCSSNPFPIDVANRLSQVAVSKEFTKIIVISAGEALGDARSQLNRYKIEFYNKDNLQDLFYGKS